MLQESQFAIENKKPERQESNKAETNYGSPVRPKEGQPPTALLAIKNEEEEESESEELGTERVLEDEEIRRNKEIITSLVMMKRIKGNNHSMEA